MELLQKHKSLKDGYITEKPISAWIVTQESSICGAPCISCKQLRRLDSLFCTAIAAAYMTSGRNCVNPVSFRSSLRLQSALLLNLVSFVYFLSLPLVTPSRIECFNSEQCDAHLPVRISTDLLLVK